MKDTNQIKTKATTIIDNLFSIKKEEVTITTDFENNIEKLKHEIATDKNYKNKKGEIDIKMVKTALLKEAIDIVSNDKPNKREIAYEELMTYITFLKDINYKAQVEQLNNQKVLIDDTKQAFKEAKSAIIIEEPIEEAIESKYDATGEDLIKACEEIVKEKTKEFKEDLTGKEKKSKSNKNKNGYFLLLTDITSDIHSQK
jgi:hypothetical protein